MKRLALLTGAVLGLSLLLVGCKKDETADKPPPVSANARPDTPDKDKFNRIQGAGANAKAGTLDAQ